MADQGKWFKLWESALDDQDLENLSIHEWFCWARFGTYLKKHGKDGKIRLRAPATALTNLLRLPSFNDVIDMLKRFPNYAVNGGQNETANVTIKSVSLDVRCLNWLKYQGDFSTERVRRYRARETANVTAQEETRGEETKSPSPKGSSPTFARPAPLGGASATRATAGNGTAPQKAAPLRAASIMAGEDERRDYGHEDFLANGYRDSAMPTDSFGWEHLAQSLSLEERVQSKMREKFHEAQAVTQGVDDVF